MSAPIVCRGCGARNRGQVGWCSQCHQELPAAPRADLDPPDSEPVFAHPDAAVAYQGRPIYSRWQSNELALGPFGRITLSLAVLLIGRWTLSNFNLMPAPALVWVFLVTPLLLRELWKKRPIGYEPTRPPIPRSGSTSKEEAPSDGDRSQDFEERGSGGA